MAPGQKPEPAGYQCLAALLLLALLLLPFSSVFAEPIAGEQIQQQLDLAESQRTSAPDNARAILKQLQQSSDSFSPAQQHQFIYIQAYLLAIQGKLSEAISLLEPLRQSPFTASRIKGHLLLANMYEARKDYTTAYESLYQALKDIAKVADQELHAAVYTVAAQLHISAGVYKQAKDFALNIAQASASPRSQCISQILVLSAEIKLHKQYARSEAREAEQRCLDAGEPLMQYTTTVYTAEVDIVDNPALVKANMLEILPALEAIGFPFTLASARYYLAQAHFKLGEISEAMALAQQVHQQASQIGDSRLENQSLLLLAEIREQNGQSGRAMDNYKAHIRALNRFMDEFKQRSIAFYLAQADYIDSQNRLALLTSENKLLQLQASAEQQQRLYATLGGSAVIGGLLLALYGLNRKRAQLTTLATTDFLTRLYNRRHFTQLVNRRLGDRRGSQVHSLLLFDLDLFKSINDQYGHDVGDKVLSHIAALCRSNIREQDFLARMGGEEFALFLPGCDAKHAFDRAEQCRAAIADNPLEVGEQKINITASFGISTATAPTEFETLFKQADEALYCCKDKGRNCCVVYQSELSGD
ncbi:diguanylate cyclase [Lacimicrobium alkaliphilum]|uniref:diguanylate cyclase n=1 Tax=Lacimicrobium alkaliphilum TaxID=1526571 RepID=A0A0U2ZG41_9ALTE|nr:diguanylate cyclase [Lacimicrobium alkaliphilum]ALS97991.1 hypothetical protein AT746_06745 [Lacimicrobium alkaliphilum]